MTRATGTVVQLPLWRQVPLPPSTAQAPVPASAQRPPVPVYIIGRANRCPDCHGEAFTVRTLTAECGGCGLPLALVDARRLR